MMNMCRRNFIIGFAASMLPSDGFASELPRIVITGHLGNIGQRLYTYYAERYRNGLEVIGIDKKDGAEFDLGRRHKRWISLLQNADVVFHLAASAGRGHEIMDYINDNFEATRILINEIGKLAKPPVFVFASSVSISQRSYGKPSEACGPDGIYGVSKVYGETLLASAASQRIVRSGVSIRIAWAPPEDWPPSSDNWTQSVRVGTKDLREKFDMAMRRPPGYSVIEMATRDLTASCNNDTL
jgi:nucleoside-diphosphate-sugar epimerase